MAAKNSKTQTEKDRTPVDQKGEPHDPAAQAAADLSEPINDDNKDAPTKRTLADFAPDDPDAPAENETGQIRSREFLPEDEGAKGERHGEDEPSDLTRVGTGALTDDGLVVEDTRAENGRVKRSDVVNPEVVGMGVREPEEPKLQRDGNAKVLNTRADEAQGEDPLDKPKMAGTTTGSTVVGTSPKELGGPVPFAAGSNPTIEMDVELGAPVPVAMTPNAPVGVEAPERGSAENQTAVVAEPLVFDSATNKVGHGGTPELPFVAERHENGQIGGRERLGAGLPDKVGQEHPWYGRRMVQASDARDMGYIVAYTEAGPPDSRRFRHVVLHNGRQLTRLGYELQEDAYRFIVNYDQGIIRKEMADQLGIDWDALQEADRADRERAKAEAK